MSIFLNPPLRVRSLNSNKGKNINKNLRPNNLLSKNNLIKFKKIYCRTNDNIYIGLTFATKPVLQTTISLREKFDVKQIANYQSKSMSTNKSFKC